MLYTVNENWMFLYKWKALISFLIHFICKSVYIYIGQDNVDLPKKKNSDIEMTHAFHVNDALFFIKQKDTLCVWDSDFFYHNRNSDIEMMALTHAL